MRNILITTTILLCALSSQAQTFKVLKLQGKKAIVEINDPALVQVNQTYSAGGATAEGGSVSAGGKASMSTGERKYGIGGTISFSNKKADTAGAEAATEMTLGGVFLWNLRQFEIGPMLVFSSSKAGNSESSSTLFGGVGYYNFSPNNAGTESLFAVKGTLGMGSGKVATVSTTSTDIALGGSYRMFSLSSDYAIEAAVMYVMEKSKAGSGNDVTTTGFELGVGLTNYF